MVRERLQFDVRGVVQRESEENFLNWIQFEEST